jgi:hypothetical protein
LWIVSMGTAVIATRRNKKGTKRKIETGSRLKAVPVEPRIIWARARRGWSVQSRGRVAPIVAPFWLLGSTPRVNVPNAILNYTAANNAAFLTLARSLNVQSRFQLAFRPKTPRTTAHFTSFERPLRKTLRLLRTCSRHKFRLKLLLRPGLRMRDRRSRISSRSKPIHLLFGGRAMGNSVGSAGISLAIFSSSG